MRISVSLRVSASFGLNGGIRRSISTELSDCSLTTAKANIAITKFLMAYVHPVIAAKDRVAWTEKIQLRTYLVAHLRELTSIECKYENWSSLLNFKIIIKITVSEIDLHSFIQAISPPSPACV